MAIERRRRLNGVEGRPAFQLAITSLDFGKSNNTLEPTIL